MIKHEISTLKNGLRVAADRMKEVETVSIGVFVGTGSRNEIPEINGISHFLEHMAFKGTRTRSAKQIAEEFENIGGLINAYTSKERTVYYVKVLKKHAEFAVEFLADILQNSTFDEDELERERGVILQEVAMTNDTPDDIVFDYFQEKAYPDQALGRCILGPEENIKKFHRQDFVDYISKQYNYSNMAVVAAGNIKQKDLVIYCERYFTNLGKQEIAKPEAAKYQGGLFLKTKALEQVNLVLGFKGLSYLHDDYYKSQILASILGGGMSSRLFQEVREKLGLAYSVYAFNYNHVDCGVFGIYGGTAPDKVEKLIEASKKEIEKVCKKITDVELQRAKTQFESGILMAKESTSSRMQKLGFDVLVRDEITCDKEKLAKINAVEKEGVLDIANSIFDSQNKVSFAAVGEVENFNEALIQV